MLCQIDAWDGSTPVTLRLASHDDERLCHLDGQQWLPAIAKLPTLRLDLFDGAFDGQITAPEGEMTVHLGELASVSALSLYDARVRLWRGTIGQSWADYVPLFDGRITEQPAVAEAVATFTMACDDAWLDDPLLATYTGEGGAEGPAELKGNVKPLRLGAPRFVEAVLVDAAANIYQISDGPIDAVEMAFDRLTRLGAASADYPTYELLDAATVAPGRWATSLATGFVRLGAPAAGLLTFAVRGDKRGSAGFVRKPGALIRRIAEIKGALPKVNLDDLDALDLAVPFNQSIDVNEQTTPRDLILALAQSVNAVAFVDWLGKLRVKTVAIGTPTLTIASDGSSLPPVATIEQIPVSVPFWRLAQKAAVTQRVHSASEIAFRVQPRPVGLYDDARVYSDGDIVSLIDGSTWQFVGATPMSGSAPVLGNANWERMTGPLNPVLYGTEFPDPASTSQGDTFVHMRLGNRAYRRLAGDGVVSIGGSNVTLGGQTLYLPPWEPVSDVRIAQALVDAALAMQRADDAWDRANEAIDSLAGLADDSILSEDEKTKILVPRAAELETQYSILVAIAASMSISTSAVAATRTTWLNMLAAISPAWNDSSQPSPVDRPTYDAARNDYDAALLALDRTVKVGAPPGSYVAGTPAGTVADGANWANNGLNPDGSVKDGQVSTGALQANSVTYSVTARASGPVTVSSTPVTIVQATITVPSGPVKVETAFPAFASGGVDFSLSLQRVTGGTTTNLGNWVLTLSGAYSLYTMMRLDEPGAGSHTYKWVISRTGASGTATANDPDMILTNFKR